MKRWSRDLAAAQTVAVVEAGGRTVSLGDLLGEEFEGAPHEMFSRDRFHPSAAGYARAAAALLPSVCAALDVWGLDTGDRPPEARRGEGVGPVAVAAGQAVREAGTEVAPTEVAGQSRGPRGRWAVLLRRRTSPVPPASDPVPPDRGRGGPPPAGAVTTTGRAAPAAGSPTTERDRRHSGTTASSSTSTFQRWSTRPATRMIELAGRISPKISPWTLVTASMTSSSVMKCRVRMTCSGDPPSSASAPSAISQHRLVCCAGSRLDVTVRVDRRRTGDRDLRADADGPGEPDGALVRRR